MPALNRVSKRAYHAGFVQRWLINYLFPSHLPDRDVKRFEPCHEKPCIRGFRPGPTQTGLYSHRRWVDVKCMQISGTGAIRTQIQPSKQKREITKITKNQTTVNRVSSYFPKRWPLSNPNRTKNNMNTHKAKHHRNSDTQNRQQRTTTKLPPWNGQ